MALSVKKVTHAAERQAISVLLDGLLNRALGASAPGQIPADLMRQVLSQAGPRMDI